MAWEGRSPPTTAFCRGAATLDRREPGTPRFTGGSASHRRQREGGSAAATKPASPRIPDLGSRHRPRQPPKPLSPLQLLPPPRWPASRQTPNSCLAARRMKHPSGSRRGALSTDLPRSREGRHRQAHRPWVLSTFSSLMKSIIENRKRNQTKTVEKAAPPRRGRGGLAASAEILPCQRAWRKRATCRTNAADRRPRR